MIILLAIFQFMFLKILKFSFFANSEKSALSTIEQQNEQLELASLSSKDADFQSHLEQSQAEYEMYDVEIRELRNELKEKNRLLKQYNVANGTVSREKYQKLKREYAKTQAKHAQLEQKYDTIKRKIRNSEGNKSKNYFQKVSHLYFRNFTGRIAQ